MRFGGLGVIAPPAFAAGGAGGIDAAVFATNSEIKAERGGEGGGGRGRPLAKPRAGFERVERERWLALAPGPVGAFLRHVAGSLEGR